jgi:endogenous inhibitor of DNA gyrase (YacG/DUF329 family)
VCPICRKQLPVLDADAFFRPFCSQRCKSIDLGSWLEGSYRISRPVEEEDPRLRTIPGRGHVTGRAAKR